MTIIIKIIAISKRIFTKKTKKTKKEPKRYQKAITFCSEWEEVEPRCYNHLNLHCYS